MVMGFKGNPKRHGLNAKAIFNANEYNVSPYQPVGMSDYMKALNIEPIPKSERPTIFLSGTYTRITRNEMERVLSKYGARIVKIDNITRETVYEIRPDEWKNAGVSLLIYSTIVGNVSRDVGKDAIRTMVVIDRNPRKQLAREVRTHRIGTWEKNLTNKIDQLLQIKVYPCPRCSKPMVVRQNKKTNDYFYGCSDFPNCRQTMPIKPK